MTDDDMLIAVFEAYRLAYEAGENPSIEETMLMAGNDYERMGELIAGYHERSPQVVDLDRVLARADASEFAPTFGEVLRAAWTREGMLRRVLVDRLMQELALRLEARGRLDERLHEVEVGAHPARQVSRRLLGALDRILPGVGAALAAVPDAPSAGSAAAAAPAFARPSGIARRVHDAAAVYDADFDEPSAFPEVDALFQAD